MSNYKVFRGNAISTTRFTTPNVFQSVLNIKRCSSNKIFSLFINVQHDRLFAIFIFNNV